MKVLIVSSRSPEYSGNLGNDIKKAFTQTGHTVTWAYDEILTEYKQIDEHLKKIRICEKNRNFCTKITKKAESVVYRICGKKTGRFFLVNNELTPQLPFPLQIKQINGQFDLAIVLFTSEMISAITIKELSCKFKCPILLFGIDMYFLTGGCHFFDNCSAIYNECKQCPAKPWWQKDYPHKNFLFKKHLFAEYDVFFICNSYMKMIASKNGIISEDKIINMSYILDEELFKPKDKIKCRECLNIPKDAKFIMLARYSSHPRKGFGYIRDSINYLFKETPKNLRSQIVLCLIGEDAAPIIDQINVYTINMCKVSFDDLIKLYNSVDVFLSSSIDDAGPSMVNQAMACGTPVVSFNIGTSVDVLQDGISGFKTDEVSVRAFADCIRKIYDLDESGRDSLRKSTRQTALANNSLGAFMNTIERFMCTKRMS